MKYGINTETSSSGKVVSTCSEDYKTILHAFLKKEHFYVHERVEI